MAELAELAIWSGIFGVFLLILAVGGFIADYIFPLIPPLERWIEKLADNNDRKYHKRKQR